MKVIIFNGPKKTGKTTAINHLLTEDDISGRYRMDEVKASEFVSDALCRMLGMDFTTFYLYYDIIKDEPMTELGGMTIREAIIWLSEDVMKTKFGQDIFGRSTVTAMRRCVSALEESDEEPVILGDIGFDEEARCVVNAFGASNVYLVRLERDGHTFVGDSRSYLNPEAIGIEWDNVIIIENNGSEDDFKAQVSDVVNQIAPHGEPSI